MRDHVAARNGRWVVTGVGGYRTPLPLALSVSLAEFYVVATRMVGAIAIVRGYDLRQPQVRTAVLLTVVASRSDEVLAEEGIGAGTLPRIGPTSNAAGRANAGQQGDLLSALRGVNARFFSRLGHGVPLLSGGIGAALDSWMLARIAGQAMVEFPPKDPGQRRAIR